MNPAERSPWTRPLIAAAVGGLAGFLLAGSVRPLASHPPPPSPARPMPVAFGDKPRQAECLAKLPLTLASVAVDEPGTPRREGPGLRVVDGQQLRVAAQGQPHDNQALVLAVDSDGLVHPMWPNTGISAPCPAGCGALQVALPASTLPPGGSLIVVYVGFGRFELPEIQDGLRNMGPAPLEARTLPMVRGARAAGSQLVVHGAPPPSP